MSDQGRSHQHGPRLLLLWLGILGAVATAGLLLLLMPSNERDNRNPKKLAQMEQLTVEWGRLAPFPEEAENFEIFTEGNSMTRTFKGSFNCSWDCIEAWIERSPGLQDAWVEVAASGRQRRYVVSPGGGASFVEVWVDDRENSVRFEAAWS